MKKWLLIFLFLYTGAILQAQSLSEDLIILPGDTYIELKKGENGLHLFIKKKPGMNSVLIAESSADPEKKADSFTLRAYDYNPVNGDELRILDGKFMDRSKNLYFLIDSTPEPNEYLGEAFHIFMPYELTYGYEWSRQGQVEVTQGMWINVRTFEKPYADYTGTYRDNAFTLSMKELPKKKIQTVPILDNENRLEKTDDILDEIDDILSKTSSDSVDLVLVLDTTISMKDDIEFIRQKVVPLVRERTKDYSEFRVGLVLYRDYKEAYLTREYPFEKDLDRLQALINNIKVSGGRDLDEAVYEGIYSAIINYDWIAPDRIIIQIGDALPHPEPRGAVTRDMVLDGAADLNITIYPILLPDEK